MAASELLVLQALRDWRLAGRRALLVTVVRTWGSSPRPPGSLMALCEDGTVQGSVSGGCIEDDLIHRHRAAAGQGAALAIPEGPPRRLSYGLTADEAHRFGLPCGGTLELLLEFNPDAADLAELVAGIEAGQLLQRRVCLADGRVALAPADADTGLVLSEEALSCAFGPRHRLLLIGAGQLAEYVATMALFNGFAVTVCDPREEHRRAWALPGVALVHGMPDDVLRELRPDARTAVVALTHDPKLDDLALLEALDSPAFYVGAIGSRRNAAARRERLIAHFDQTPEGLARLHSPVGLAIGSKTPAEIAVSVMAELLAVRNGVALPRAKALAEVGCPVLFT